MHTGDTIFLDSGTTTAALARVFAQAALHDIHVVTNNLLVVQALAGSSVPLTLIGGEVRKSSMSTLGPIAQLALIRLTVDKALLGADGVFPGRGLCEATADQAYLKECLMRYIRQYNKQAAPLKWKYSDPTRRIRCNSSVSMELVAREIGWSTPNRVGLKCSLKLCMIGAD